MVLIWWTRKDLNLEPMDYESSALTVELRVRWRDYNPNGKASSICLRASLDSSARFGHITVA